MFVILIKINVKVALVSMVLLTPTIFALYLLIVFNKLLLRALNVLTDLCFYQGEQLVHLVPVLLELIKTYLIFA